MIGAYGPIRYITFKFGKNGEEYLVFSPDSSILKKMAKGKLKKKHGCQNVIGRPFLLATLFILFSPSTSFFTASIQQLFLMIFIPPAKRIFWGILESACQSVYKILVSVKALAGVLSHIILVTSLVFFFI